MTQPTSSNTSSRTSGRPLWIRLVMLTLLIGVTLVGLGLWAWSSQPTYVGRMRERIQAIPADERANVAAGFENQFTQALNHLYDTEQTGNGAFPSLERGATASQSRHGVTVTRLGADREQVRLELLPLNLWLHERFNAWLEAQGTNVPEGVGAPVLAVRDGRARVAVPVQRGGMRQVVDLTISIEPADDGRLRVELHNVRMGRLPVPREQIVSRLGQRLNADEPENADEAMTRWLEDRLVEAVIPVDQTRARRIVNVVVQEEALTLTLVAEPRQ